MTQVSFKNACILVTLELSNTCYSLPFSQWSTPLPQRCGLDWNRVEQKFKKEEAVRTPAHMRASSSTAIAHQKALPDLVRVWG